MCIEELYTIICPLGGCSIEQKLVVIKCNAVKYMGIEANDCPGDWTLRDIEAVAYKRICDDCIKSLEERKAREWQLALTRWEKEMEEEAQKRQWRSALEAAEKLDINKRPRSLLGTCAQQPNPPTELVQRAMHELRLGDTAASQQGCRLVVEWGCDENLPHSSSFRSENLR